MSLHSVFDRETVSLDTLDKNKRDVVCSVFSDKTMRKQIIEFISVKLCSIWFSSALWKLSQSRWALFSDVSVNTGPHRGQSFEPTLS